MYLNKLRLTRWYIRFIEKSRYSFWEKGIQGFLYLASLLYGFLVSLRNFFYDKGFLKSYESSLSFLLGVGNIVWAGTGKTPLSLWLYKQFASEFKTAILRRGYGKDEEKLIKQYCSSLFSSVDRRGWVQKLEKEYDLFILDDAFQHRKLKKDIEIVIMGSREFEKKAYLIPASFFREPFRSLKRADIVIVNYKMGADRRGIEKMIQSLPSSPKLYFAAYQAETLSSLGGKTYTFEILEKKAVAAFAAIGYPQGFFDLLEEKNIRLKQKIIYPDHYELSPKEYSRLEADLINSGINTLIITEKDKYHLPDVKKQLDIFVLGVKLEIEQQKELADIIRKKINAKLKKKII